MARRSERDKDLLSLALYGGDDLAKALYGGGLVGNKKLRGAARSVLLRRFEVSRVVNEVLGAQQKTKIRSLFRRRR
jgi:hypothetical protein